LSEGHIEFHLFESLGFLTDLLDGVELLDDGVVFGEGDVFEIDHDFIERNVVITT
jgi:hypothetical protein